MENLVQENSDVTAAEFNERKSETLDSLFQVMRGHITEDDYWSAMLIDTNWSIGVEQLKDLFRQNVSIPVAGTAEIVRDLKKNHNVFLLSDYAREWTPFILDFHKDLELFDQKHFSFESGKLKSDEGAFPAALEKFQISASETIFVDDLATNINAAGSHGIQGILFKDADDLRKQLAELKVL